MLALCFRPDGKQLAASTLDGNISFWDPQEAESQGFIEGRRDIKGGRLASDRRAAGNLDSGACFSSLSYGADGSFLLAGELGRRPAQSCLNSNSICDHVMLILLTSNSMSPPIESFFSLSILYIRRFEQVRLCLRHKGEGATPALPDDQEQVDRWGPGHPKLEKHDRRGALAAD